LEIAERRVYRPLWSPAILGELDRAIHRIQQRKGVDPQFTRTYVSRLVSQMGAAFPDALVTGWEPLVGTVELPDSNDRHVVVAAIAGRADVIVTENQADFPSEKLPRPLFTQTTDTFLLDSFDLYLKPVLDAIRRVADRTGRLGPPRAARYIVQWLGKQDCPQFAAAVSPAF